MDAQTLATGTRIKRDLDILSAFGSSIDDMIQDQAKTPMERLDLINTAYKLIREGVSDADTVTALNVCIADFATATLDSINDSIALLNTALTALCTPQP